MRFVGIDPSLTCTGVAVVEEHKLPVVFSLPTSGRRAATLADRQDRLERITLEATGPADDATLVAIENPAYGTPGGSVHDRSGLWWLMVNRLIRWSVPVGTVAPATRAKWATSHGHADKDAVKDAVERLWFVNLRNDNEADALCLATMAAQFAGADVPQQPWQLEALTAAEWPDHDVCEGEPV